MGADEPEVSEPTSKMEANGPASDETTTASNNDKVEITAQATEDKKNDLHTAEEIVAGSKTKLDLDSAIPDDAERPGSPVRTPAKQRPPALDSTDGDLGGAAVQPTPTGSSMPSTPAPAAPPPLLGADPEAVPEPPQAPPSKVPEVVPGAKAPSLVDAVPPPSPAAMAAVQHPASPGWVQPGLQDSTAGQGYWDPAAMPYPSPSHRGYWPMSPGQVVPPSPQAVPGTPGQGVTVLPPSTPNGLGWQAAPPPPTYAAPSYAAPAQQGPPTTASLLPSQPAADNMATSDSATSSPIKSASSLGLRADATEFVMPVNPPVTVPPPAGYVPQARPHISILPDPMSQPVPQPVPPPEPLPTITPSNTKGMSPRSALLSLCGAWGALSGSTTAEATAIRNPGDVPTPISREVMLKYRRALAGCTAPKEMETFTTREESKLQDEGDDSQSPNRSPRRGGKGGKGKGRNKKQ